MNSLYIWWVDQQDLELLNQDLECYICLEAAAPPWLTTEVHSADGRNGRGRLWVAPHFTDVPSIDPWPDTPLAKHCGNCAGIVVSSDELSLLATFPGIVTDFQLKRT